MATEVIMPQMGFDMKEGTLVRWLKKEGDAITKGEPLAEIETDKAVVEVEAYASGILRKTYVEEGTTVPVGHLIGVIGAADEAVPDAAPEAVGATKAHVDTAAAGSNGASAVPPTPAPAPGPVAAAPRTGERIKASPLARKEAEARGLDLAAIAGTGPGGRITRDDVINATDQTVAAPVAPARAAAAEAPAATPPMLGELVPLTRMRQAIARNMTRSKQEIPHVYITVAVNMTEALRVRAQVNEALGGDVRVSINDMIIKACAKAIRKHPIFNSSFTEAGLQIHEQVNIGVAIALDDGLVAPGILNCDQKSLAEIAAESSSLAKRARSGHLTAQEFGAATFNVTNLGMYGAETFSAIITPPQAAALAVGAVKKEPVVKEGEIAAGDVMRVTLSIDHRAADGAQGAAFVSDIRANLENPVSLLL